MRQTKDEWCASHWDDHRAVVHGDRPPGPCPGQVLGHGGWGDRNVAGGSPMGARERTRSAKRCGVCQVCVGGSLAEEEGQLRPLLQLPPHQTGCHEGPALYQQGSLGPGRDPCQPLSLGGGPPQGRQGKTGTLSPTPSASGGRPPGAAGAGLLTAHHREPWVRARCPPASGLC